MLLCEVALGDMNELLQADYHASNLPAGKLSTKGCGVNYPDPAKNLVLDSGVVVPLGPEKKTSLPGSSLLYNEVSHNEREGVEQAISYVRALIFFRASLLTVHRIQRVANQSQVHGENAL